MQIVWFKRDLRIHDHAPLRTAVKDCLEYGPVLCLYIHEPSMAARADCSRQHTEFARECLAELSFDISRLGGHLVQLVGEAPAVFEKLHQVAKDHAFPDVTKINRITRILAHEETTTMDGFARDKAVGAWARSAGVIFHEVAQNAVERGSRIEKNGHDFKGHVNRALSTESFGIEAVVAAARTGNNQGNEGNEKNVLVDELAVVRFKEAAGLTQFPEFPVGQGADKPRRLKGGRSAALAQLNKFADLDKLIAYPGSVSSPNTAAAGCSRLSPYLTLGVVSDREVIFHLFQLQRAGMSVTQESSADPEASKKRARAVENGIQFFAQRLYWRAGYLQLMESYPRLEIEPEVTTLLAAREPTRGYSEYAAHHRFEQWTQGRTGVPMIDAAMRLLNATGWANFRLRGAVTSFALNELWLPWRDVSLHLAREFLDFEPAIHYSQVAIHGGLLRGSRPLIYSAVKQARDHDANGEFVKAWIPELAMVPLAYLFEPWTMPQAVQDQSGCQLGTDYPRPLVDIGAAHTCAKTRVYALWQGETDPGGAPHLARPAKMTAEDALATKSKPSKQTPGAVSREAKEDQLALF